MPERVLALSKQVMSLTAEKVNSIRSVTRGSKVLALNAAIEAGRAGEAGAGFAIVAREVGSVSSKIETLAEDLQLQLANKTDELTALSHGLDVKIRGSRLADLALNMIDIIDRNLYERSCDVRWWATDSAVVDCVAVPGQQSANYASSRLGVILDSYTVYLDLWIADREGNVLSSGRGRKFPDVIGLNVSAEPWFRRALDTRDGTEFVACDISVNKQLGNAPVGAYSAAIREGGKNDGRVLGVLGIFFDWEKQSQNVVDGVRLTPEDRAHTCSMILDSSHRIIASSNRGHLFESYSLNTGNQPIGSHVDKAGNIVGFALTPGFETYQGLGWYGALVQTRRG